MSNITCWTSKGESISRNFFQSKQNSNSLLELEELLLSSEEKCVLAMLPVMYNLFSKVYPMHLQNTASHKGSKNGEYSLWLLSRYEDFISNLLSFLSHANADIQIKALEMLLLLVKLESEHPAKNDEENPNFPFSLFKRIICGLASKHLKQHHLIKIFQEYTKCDDVKLYLLKSLQVLLAESTEEVSEVFIQNCLLLLCSMKFPKSFSESTSFAYRLNKQEPFCLKEKLFRKLFTSVWNSVLSCELPADFLEKFLPVFSENVLPHLQNPCLMTDFFTNSYNKGGIFSLLALKGLYFLMDQYNLEYPDFFDKFYALLEKDILNGKYSSRFFHLADLFLSSTHLPVHIVAAFVKKLGRLSLVSSGNVVLKVLCLISKLLADHSSLKTLIHWQDGQETADDPFSMDSTHPLESNALKSSLWEIQALKHHINPEVSLRAKELLDGSLNVSFRFSDISGVKMHNLYSKQRKRKFSNVTLSVKRPVKLQRSSS